MTKTEKFIESILMIDAAIGNLKEAASDPYLKSCQTLDKIVSDTDKFLKQTISDWNGCLEEDEAFVFRCARQYSGCQVYSDKQICAPCSLKDLKTTNFNQINSLLKPYLQ